MAQGGAVPRCEAMESAQNKAFPAAKVDVILSEVLDVFTCDFDVRFPVVPNVHPKGIFV